MTIDELITAYGNANFDCGNWDEDESDLPYATVNAACIAARKALADSIAEKEAEVASLQQQLVAAHERAERAIAMSLSADSGTKIVQEENASLREQLRQLQVLLKSSNIPALCQCSECRDICEVLAPSSKPAPHCFECAAPMMPDGRCSNCGGKNVVPTLPEAER